MYEKSVATNIFLYETISESFVFQGVDYKGKMAIVGAMQERDVKAGEVIIAEGEVGDYFYILQTGKVVYVVGSEEVGNGEAPASFGELALLYDTPRAATVKATSACKLWRLDQKTFRFIMVSSTTGDDEKIYAALRKVKLFSSMSPDFFVKLSNAMTLKSFDPGHEIIKKGDVGNTFYVVREGKVKVSDIGFDANTKFDDHELGAGDFFGERALLTGDKRAATISAIDKCSVLCLERDEFETIIGHLDSLLKLAGIRSMLVSTFKYYQSYDLYL